MSEEVKKAVEAIVKDSAGDPGMMSFLAGVQAGKTLAKIEKEASKDAQN